MDLEKLTYHKKELLANKDVAFKFILTEETQHLGEMREELSFYTNQCWFEVKRVAAENIKLFKDAFLTQSQL